MAVGKTVSLLFPHVWSHPIYAHHKIHLHEGLEEQVTKVFLGGPCLKSELNDSKTVNCPPGAFQQPEGPCRKVYLQSALSKSGMFLTGKWSEAILDFFAY